MSQLDCHFFILHSIGFFIQSLRKAINHMSCIDLSSSIYAYMSTVLQNTANASRNLGYHFGLQHSSYILTFRISLECTGEQGKLNYIPEDSNSFYNVTTPMIYKLNHNPPWNICSVKQRDHTAVYIADLHRILHLGTQNYRSCIPKGILRSLLLHSCFCRS